MVGVVLMGGSSRRMGVDKATLVVDGTALGARVGEALRGAGCAEVLAVGGQIGSSRYFGVTRLADRRPGAGPAAAVADLLSELGGPLVVLACDLPWITAASVRDLIDHAARHTDADAVIAGRAGRPQYPNGVWRRVNAAADGCTFARLLEGRSVVLVDADGGFDDADHPGDLPDGR